MFSAPPEANLGVRQAGIPFGVPLDSIPFSLAE
jgi:hypothetical protein